MSRFKWCSGEGFDAREEPGMGAAAVEEGDLVAGSQGIGRAGVSRP
ncbi:MAG TPA: hypothetical protein VMN57_06270 [Anaerolineales bacterium]|nr:hypothetical protein [Anaerolineales bacterium]